MGYLIPGSKRDHELEAGCTCEALNYGDEITKDNPTCPYHHGQGEAVMDSFVVAAGMNELKRHVHKAAVDHGWWPKHGRNMGEMIALMHSELSEALEEYRDNQPHLYFKLDEPPEGSCMVGPQKWEGPEELCGVLGKPEGLAAEFADVIIRILDTCERLNIPITRALIVKHNYNLTRPYRHGGKLA